MSGGPTTPDAEWLLYVEHLKADYPYLFSLVVRMHPFQEAPSPW